MSNKKQADHKIYPLISCMVLFVIPFFLFCAYNVYGYIFLDKEITSRQVHFGAYFGSFLMLLVMVGFYFSIKLTKKDKLIINQKGIEFGVLDSYRKVDFHNIEKVTLFSKEDCLFHTKGRFELINNEVKLTIWNYKINPEEFIAVLELAADKYGFLIEKENKPILGMFLRH